MKAFQRGLVAAGAVGAMVATTAANAALDAAVTTAVTSAGTDGTSLFGAVVGSLGALYILIRIAKKFGLL